MKIVNIDGENLYLLSDLRNFNDIFRKDVTYDIKIKKKKWPHPLTKRCIEMQRVKKDNEMSGNIPSGNFLGENSPGGIFQRGV